MIKPIIKYQGGKTKELPLIKQLMPTEFNRVIEPFTGGAAVSFALEKPAVLNDINRDVINLYSIVANEELYPQLQIKVDYIKGWGKFNSATEIAVDLNDGGSQVINAEKTIIATGSEPSSLPAGLLDIDEEFVVTSTGALALKAVPKSMVVVGGGVIGLEMGSVYARLGTEVTVVQHTERICPFLDIEVSKMF